MATHSSILAWRIPVDRGTWWATVHGVTKNQIRLSNQASTGAQGGAPVQLRVRLNDKSGRWVMKFPYSFVGSRIMFSSLNLDFSLCPLSFFLFLLRKFFFFNFLFCIGV